MESLATLDGITFQGANRQEPMLSASSLLNRHVCAMRLEKDFKHFALTECPFVVRREGSAAVYLVKDLHPKRTDNIPTK